MRTGTDGARQTYIVFDIAEAAYAVPSEQVVMLEMVDSITRVPNAPPFVEGVTAVRGQIIPVISVRRRFRMEPIPLDLRARLVVIRLGERQVGLLVDTAREFARISGEQIHPAEGLSGPGVDYLSGVAALPDRLILVVNLERLLNFEEKAALAAQEPPAQAGPVRPGAKTSEPAAAGSTSPVDAAPKKRSRKG